MSYPQLSVRSSPAPASHPARCGWFWAWALVGTAAAFGLISLGALALVPAGILGWALSRRRGARHSAWGLLTGAAVPLLLVAFLNRAGPGATCYRTATSAGCDQHLNPVPWLVTGLVLATAGLVAQARRGD